MQPQKTMQLQIIAKKIFEVRGQRVMLDKDLALLYEVSTKSLNLAVKRNIDRFPSDFMFRLSKAEFESLRFQIETSKRGGTRYLPYAFTELGVAMLSSVLNSKKAIKVNIAIMRAFVLLRQNISDYKDLKEKIEISEREMNLKFEDVQQALNYLLSPQGQRVVIRGFISKKKK